MNRTRSRAAHGPSLPLRVYLLPPLSVVLASMLTAWPAVVSAPLLPPLGLMLFLGWRLLRPDIWPVWAALPLGLWDDLASGHPLGTAMFSWTAILLGLALFDQRVVWRDYRIEWLLGTVALAFSLIVGALLARAGTLSECVLLILPQWGWSALLLPLVMLGVATLDRWRLRR